MRSQSRHDGRRKRGAFDDAYFAQPSFSVWEERLNGWVEGIGDDVEHQFQERIER